MYLIVKFQYRLFRDQDTFRQLMCKTVKYSRASVRNSTRNELFKKFAEQLILIFIRKYLPDHSLQISM